jgi:hypothetical protein
MDIDSYDNIEIESNGAASNSDRYITPVEYQVPLMLICPLNYVRNCASICLDMSLAFKSGTLLHSPPAMPLPLP